MSVPITCKEKKTTEGFFMFMHRLENLVNYDGAEYISNQGQSLDGYSELACYRDICGKLVSEWHNYCEVTDD